MRTPYPAFRAGGLRHSTLQRGRGKMYDQGNDLSDYIDRAIDDFRQDRERYWYEQDPRFLSIYADFLAGRMISAATDLTVPQSDAPKHPDNTWDKHVKDAESEEMRDEVMEGIQLVLAEDLSRDLTARAKRCKELTSRILADKPPLPVLKYVRRLTRCYIAGFYPECVILCRGVMENAVKQQFGRKNVDIPATEGGKSTMRTTLDAAKMFGWLTPQTHDDAWTIWTRGNKAVHEDIEVTTDAFGTIMMTINVLKDLYGVVE